MGAILKWIAAAIRDWLNGYLNPNWKAEQEQFLRDAAAHQRAHAETEKVNAEVEARVEAREQGIAQRDGEIEASQKVVEQNTVEIGTAQADAAGKLKQVVNADSIEEVLRIK